MQFLSRFIWLTVQNRPSILRSVGGVQTLSYVANYSTVASNKEPPPKPKKPLNMFLRFSAEIRPKVIAENPQAKLTEVGSIIGEMWRKTNDDVRERLKNAFEEDMKCYRTQLTAYNEYLVHNPEIQFEKKKNNRNQKLRLLKNRLKQMGYPSRPINPMALFLLSKKNTKPANMEATEFLKLLQKEWSSLSDNEKQNFRNKFVESKKQYLEDVKKWHASLDQASDDNKIKLLKKLEALKAQTSRPKKLSAAYILYMEKSKAEKPEELSHISWIRELNSRWNSMSTAGKREYGPLPRKSQMNEGSENENRKTAQPSNAKKPKKKTQTVIEAAIPDTVIEVQTNIRKELLLEETQSTTVEEQTTESCSMSDTKVLVDKQSVQVPKMNSFKNIYENLIGFFKR